MMRLLVKLVSPSFRCEAEDLFHRLGFSVAYQFEGFPLYVVEGSAELDAADYGFILSVEVDRPVPPMFVPNDTYYGNQSYLQKLNLETAWDRATGTGVVIADCDTGVPSGLAEFDGQTLPGWNVITSTSDVTPDSGVLHGTFVAGVMVAKTNSQGITGVAFNSKVVPIRVDVPGSSGGALSSNIIAGIAYAADHPDISIINVSYLLTTTPETFDDVIAYAASKGKLVVTSAGNTSTVISTPFVEALVVSGINNDYSYWGSSNYGAAIDITAVASSVYSLNNSGSVSVGNGTSFSSPQVAAVAALVKGVYPQYNAYDLKALLVGSANRNPVGSSWGVGRNDRVGAGIVDAVAALNLADAKTWVRLKYKNPVATIQTTLNGECAIAGVSTTFTLITKAIHAPIVSRTFVVDGVDQGVVFSEGLAEVPLTLGSGNHVLELTAIDAVGGATTTTNIVRCLQSGTTTSTELSIPTRVPQGKTLQARVRAKNISGEGPWTSWASINSGTSAILPDAPRLSEVYNNGANAELHHEAMSHSTGYQYRVDGGSPIDGGGYPIIIPRDVGKSVQIRSTYPSGEGAWSQSYTVDPVPVTSDMSLVIPIQNEQGVASEETQGTVSVSSGAVQNQHAPAFQTLTLLTDASSGAVGVTLDVVGAASLGQHVTESAALANQTGATQLVSAQSNQSNQSEGAPASQPHTLVDAFVESHSHSAALGILQVSQVSGGPCDSHTESGEGGWVVGVPLTPAGSICGTHSESGAILVSQCLFGGASASSGQSIFAEVSQSFVVFSSACVQDQVASNSLIVRSLVLEGIGVTQTPSSSSCSIMMSGPLQGDPGYVVYLTHRDFTVHLTKRIFKV